MKRFRVISIAFIAIIAVIFICNVYYLANLYRSIRVTVEKDVMSAIADADLDEIWIRAERARNISVHAAAEREEEPHPQRSGEVSAGINGSGTIVSTTRHVDGSTTTSVLEHDEANTLGNMVSQTIGREIHSIIDEYIEPELGVMDSLLTLRLNSRHIFPDYIYTEIINPEGEVLHTGANFRKGNYDVFTYCFNSNIGNSYRVYITPLTRHILSEMAGVITTVFLLIVSFALAFIYLFRTVSRLRTIEEMKDDFVSNMTHELKTPISIAYSANDALLNYDTANDPAKKEKYLKIANRQLKRLGELVENILAMSMERRRSMQLKIEQIELRPFLEEIASGQRMRGDKKITIDIECPEEITVVGDKTHLANVINNLIDNAIKYSGDSVNIMIRGGGSSISVSDNGIGIPAKALPYLFNKFYRVPHGNRQDVRGYGIGLYYVKCISEKMGWSIDVKSREGEGSVFTLKLNKDE